ncbi:hypothetical protein TNCT_100571 [Trichonephila clavata]|uniref:Uncharacterized protein n=1 Tax=Trichonephila clavata TaxID=2740835 RepID=A0A8X6K8Y2_TRICU|nr:hypothetical protein TNCT_100571 [Trichonephila clavata]
MLKLSINTTILEERKSYVFYFFFLKKKSKKRRTIPSPPATNWAFPASPKETFGTASTCGDRTHPPPSAARTPPPSASPRARAPSFDGICAGSRTRGRARRCPSTRDHR